MEEERERKSESVSRSRVEALSDGVFAVALTLLVLELHVPQLASRGSLVELGRALVALAPKFVSWVIAFGTLCVIWLNHHRLFAMLRRLDNTVYWWNAYLLLAISFVPFPTALMGDYARNRLAVSVYGVVMLLMGMGFVLLRLHLQRHPDLLEERVDQREFRRGTRYTLLLGPVTYAVGAGLAWVSPYLAFACYGGIGIYFLFPHSTRAQGGGRPRGRDGT